MSMAEIEMSLEHVTEMVAGFMLAPADPAKFCEAQMDRAVEDDNLTALLFWRAVSKRLTP